MKENDFAVRTALKAGRFLLRNFKKDASLLRERGVAKEITTRFDKESDALIRREIERRFPGHNLLTEENGFTDKRSEWTWIVDSLDGTSNYAVGNPFFAVSIALAKNNELVLGVVHAPFLRELFAAEKGKGAFLNGKRIHVSKTSELEKSYVVACEGGEETNARIARINARLHPRVKDLRKLGSAAIEGAWVAAGRAEAYVTTKICVWDVAAAVLLVKEAGGKVTDFRGAAWSAAARQCDVVFSNGLVHEELLEAIKRVNQRF